MKKFLLLSLMTMAIASCSTDDVNVDLQENSTEDNIAASKSSIDGQSFATGCFNSASGDVFIDLPDGLGGAPLLTFVASTQGANSRSVYTVAIEFETLRDCENLEDGTGEIITYTLGNFVNPDLNSPSISLDVNDLPEDCYRWRFSFVNRPKSAQEKFCSTYSEWYDAPLF